MRYDHYHSGQIYGIRYSFKAGERLAPHAHVGELVEQMHNIIVLRGSVLFEGSERRVLQAGEVYDFDGARTHSIRALEDSVTLHLMLQGMPPSYAAYTPEQRHGEA